MIGAQTTPEKAVVDNEKLNSPPHRLGDGHFAGIYSNSDGLHIVRSLNLEAIKCLGVIRKRGNTKGLLKELEDVF